MILPLLKVKDVSRSIEFYTQNLGFEPDMALDGPDGRVAFAFVKINGASLGLSLRGPDNCDGEPSATVDFMIYVSEAHDIDSLYSQVQTKGLQVTQEITTAYYGDRVFTVLDPDGYSITMAKTIEIPDMEKMVEIMKSGQG
jgi:PhnB protein